MHDRRGIEAKLRELLEVQDADFEYKEREGIDELERAVARVRETELENNVVDADLIKSRIEASEARTDVKFAKLEGKIDLLLDRVATVQANSADAKAEARTTRRTMIGTAVALAGLMVALLGLFTNGFNVGSKVQDIANATYAARLSETNIMPAPTPSLSPKMAPTLNPKKP